MPIKIPNDLPAATTLREEGVEVMAEQDAARQDIRPLEIAVLNLMPEKIKTETQIARQLGRSPLQVEMTLLTTSTYKARNAPEDHMAAFYQTWEDVKNRKFDGLIITGAPIERLDFEEVHYWPEICEVLDWAASNAHGSLYLCWAGQAALYHHYGIPKYDMGRKLSGVFRHQVLASDRAIVSGFDDEFTVPVSRWTEIHADDIKAHPELEILAVSQDAGICLMQSRDGGQVFMFNHLEYDRETLGDEYRRDLESGGGAEMPVNYFPGDDPAAKPMINWRSHGQLLYGNWLNMLYQTTPFDMSKIGEK